MKRVGKGFSGRDTPLFPTMMVQAQQEQGEGSAMPTDPQHTPTIIQPSTSQRQLKQRLRRLKRKDTEVPQPSGPTDNVADEVVYEEMDDSLERAVTTATSLDADQDRVSDLEKTKTSQAQEITSLKMRVKRLEKKGGSRTHGLKRLYKVGLSRRVESFNEEGLGEEDASKQGRIADIDADAGINLVSTHFDVDTDMFGVHDLVGDEVVVETEVASKDVNLSIDEVTLAQALAALKSAKLKADKVMLQELEQGTITTTTAATTVTAASTRPKAKGLDKGKGKMVKPEKPMKKKELIRLDEEIASKLQAEFDEEDNVQAMIDVDYQMAQQMQAKEQEKLSIEEKSKLFVQLLEARKKHFAAMRAQEKRNKPPTKAQKRNTMSTYLKNMAGYNHNQLKTKSFHDIQKLFDKAMTRVNTFVDIVDKI
ncbi:hypothetical protein Tco_0013096 [Tanacetum coccineum]